MAVLSFVMWSFVGLSWDRVWFSLVACCGSLVCSGCSDPRVEGSLLLLIVLSDAGTHGVSAV